MSNPLPPEFAGPASRVAQDVSAVLHLSAGVIELKWRERLALSESRLVLPFVVVCGLVDEVRYGINRNMMGIPPGASIVRIQP